MITTADIVGAWVSIFLTLCILSYLYEDNPVYKLAEHIFLGISIAISTVEQWFGVFKPNMVDRLSEGRGLSLVPLVLCAMLFFKLSRKLSWVARIPIAFIVAAFAGVKLTGEANANLMTQLSQSIPNLPAVWAEHGWFDLSADGAGVISAALLVVGLGATLFHFTFSVRESRVQRWVSRFGVLMLMLAFGASFGYTVMGRISLAIGRVYELLGMDRTAAEAAVIHPQLATLVCGALVIGILAVWKRGQRASG